MRACNCRIRPDGEPGRDSDAGFISWESTPEGKSPTSNRPTPGRERPDLVGRLLNFVGWIVPTAILTLLPKCPACVAGYAVIGTSVGFSLSAFAQLRTALIVLCIVFLSYLGTRSAVYLASRIAAKRYS
jgi:hypothetical protein